MSAHESGPYIRHLLEQLEISASNPTNTAHIVKQEVTALKTYIEALQNNIYARPNFTLYANLEWINNTHGLGQIQPFRIPVTKLGERLAELLKNEDDPREVPNDIRISFEWLSAVEVEETESAARTD